jgi:anti-sigma factor (TIGR02949 family)
MNCQDALDRVHLYTDGELDALASRGVEDHLLTCPACERAYQLHADLSDAVRTKARRYAAPAHLRARIRSASGAGPVSPAKLGLVPWGWLGVGASLAVALMMAWNLAFLGPAALDDERRLVDETVANHIRSLMANHLTDVASTDQHTVKPWFDGKVDFAPPVVDLAAQGFPLLGGRLEYLDGRAVAALVYRHRKHLINLFIWPTPEAKDSSNRAIEHQGYNVIHFTHSSMAFWAVSDVNPTELARFTHLLVSN